MEGRTCCTPFTMPCAAKNIMVVRAVEKIMFCPELRKARDDAIFNDESSYFERASSYRLISCFSLPKCCTMTLARNPQDVPNLP